MTTIERLAILLCVIAMASAPFLAFADEGEDVELSAEEAAQLATEYYAEASEAYGAGQYGRAAELLGQAFEHDADLIYRYNQVMAFMGLGAYDEALDLLADYEQAMTDDERFDDIADLRLELKEYLAAKEAEEQRAEERRAEEERAKAEREAEDDEELTAPPEVEDSNALGWALAGTGTAALATGILLSSGVLVGDQIDRLESSRTAESESAVYDGRSFERQDDLDTLRTHQVLSAVFLSSGAIMAATGGMLLKRAERSETETDADGFSSLRLAPSVGADRAGAVLRGRF